MLLLSATAVMANNARVNGKLVPVMSVEGNVQLNFSISWDNAWNDPYNWDAVWAFVKYRKTNDAGAWKHAYLATSGHQATGLNICPGDNDGLRVGVFLFPQANGAANMADRGVSLQLAAEILNDVTADEVMSGDVDFSIQLIEMVLIPEGSFYAGDGASAQCLAAVDDPAAPALITSEQNMSVLLKSEKYELSDRYPKGYAGFYAMKYELSQAQYVDFLNKLSRQQQQVTGRVPDLAALKSGDYIFGDKTKPGGRNGIVVYVNEPDRPAIFANNLTPDHLFNAENDGQTLACNFISSWEMMNYCDWAGLRPMSELEFEKACRKPYPEKPLPNEYAWNTTVCQAITTEAELVNPFSEKEYATDVNKNVNCGNHIGPLRCGVFAANPAPVGREMAGATCTGLFEMSGNLREMCYHIESGFKYTTNMAEYLGDGKLNYSGITDIADNFWPKAGNAFMLKGGGFTSATSELRISDRSQLRYITNGQKGDSTTGFRAVRNVPDPLSYVDPGKVVGANGKILDTLCSGPDIQTYQLQNIYLPSFKGDVSGMRFNYQWYVKKGSAAWELLRGEINPILNYQDAFVNTTDQPLAWQFRRDVIFPGGCLSSPLVQVWILNVAISASADEDLVDGCGISTGITVAAKTKVQFSWTFNGRELLSGVGDTSVYKAKRAHFEGYPDASPYDVLCEAKAGRCKVSRTFAIRVETALADPADCPCGADIVDDDGKVYPTVQIGGQCWMAGNLNTGDQRRDIAALDTTYKKEGIQKGCYGDRFENCAAYGAMYTWWEVLCGGECSATFNKSDILWRQMGSTIPDPLAGSPNATLKSWGVKLSDNGKFIQGICPKGWHLPNDAEWKVLEMYIGMTLNTAQNLETWSRPVSGNGIKKLMEAYGYGVDAWCLGSECNQTGFTAYFGGYVEKKSGSGDVIADDAKSIRWWTASDGGAYSAGSMVRGISMDAAISGEAARPAMGSHSVGRNSAMYIRCLKD